MSYCRCGSCASCGGWCGTRCAPYDVYNGIPVQDLPAELPLTVTDQTQFEWFQALLEQAVTSESFVAGNKLLQDAAYREDVLRRIRALNDGLSVHLTFDDVALVTPSVVTKDESNRQLRFRGTVYPRVLALPDTTVYRPSYVATRTPTVAVPEPTVLADTATGVWLLDSNGTPTRRIDGWNEGDALGGYQDVTSLAVWEDATLGDAVLAMVMPLHHVVRLFNLRTGLVLATLGTWNTPGASSIHLNLPSGCAYHDGTLFVTCAAGLPSLLIGGIPITAVGQGFVNAWDVAIPGTPVGLGVLAACTATGTLVNGEVQDPRGAFVFGDSLWLSNGVPAEVASWPLPLPALTPLRSVQRTRYFGSDSFPEAVWSDLGPPAVREFADGPDVLCVPDRGTGYIFTIRLDRNAIRALYRTRWTRDEFKAPNVLPVTSSPACAIPDRRTVGGVLQDVMWVCDPPHGTVWNICEPQDTRFLPSRVLYRPQTFQVPVRVMGYAVQGTVPADRLRVSYKTSPSDPWKDLEVDDCTDPTTELIVRLTVELPFGQVGDGYTVQAVRLLCRAA